jgi:4'-phosphopantetheinyl transferase
MATTGRVVSGDSGWAGIDLWEAALDALPVSALAAALRVLSDKERKQVARLRRDADRRRAVLRRALLRQLLGSYLGEPAAAVSLVASPMGKPSVRGNDVHFNVSHSDGRVLYAFSWGRPVGVDLERARPVAGADEIVASFFAPEESRRYAALPAPLRPPAFVHLWTCKEAYVKGTGEGLGLDFRRFDVVGSGDRALVRRRDESPLARDDWHVCGLSIDDGHRAAVACPGGPPELHRRYVRRWPSPSEPLEPSAR